MKKILMTLALLALAGVTSAATLKIATVTPEGSQWMSDMRAGADDIKQRTEGRVQIKFYGGGVMGDDAKVLGKIRIRALQGGAFTPTALAQIYPNLNLYGLPLVFRSEAEALYARSKLDARLHDGLLQAGFKSFGFASGGFAYLMSNKPVARLADLKGQKVWVPEGDMISYSSMEALSLSPVTLPLTDVLTGLQTGLIDIVGMSPIGALVLQWHTKVKYVTELPMLYTLGFMAIDVKAWDKISAADQAIVEDVMRRMYTRFDEQNLVDNRDARDALIKSGVKSVPFSVEEYEKIRVVMMESNRKLGEQGKFSIDLYDEMLGYIEEYRSKE
ncbi:MAG: TRAP transporter substrate-binding protein DctP [Woeseiaceae bacterium]